MSLADDVREFHTAAGIVGRQTPGFPPEDRIRARMRFIAEEFLEALDAVFASGHPALIDAREALNSMISDAPIIVDLPEFADALGDLDYVIEGTRQEFGIDGAPIAKAIHATNMAKFPRYGVAKIVDGKIQKPAGWKPPDIAAELCAQGWEIY